MYALGIIFTVLIQNSVPQAVPRFDRARITIFNTGLPNPFLMSQFDAGPSVGDMLGNHFFPGIDFYNSGRYGYAQSELAYVIARPEYLAENAHQKEYMSTSHYLTGMIYMYHADGLGRRNVAREHFEKAIEWNPNNYVAYIELAKVFAELRITKHASAIIERLLELNPPESIATEARDELKKLSLNER